ncbi:hypothetical protein ACP4OV_027340 [Aristida adscensionis]
MGLSEAVQWWEEWQLRLLVLASLFIQCFLLISAPLRKCRIKAWFRFTIWLAYLGSDAVAIYALATLFNRHKKQEWVATHQSSASLQVLWAPILLVHLGGQMGITAYNIEDNELWGRYVLTSVSQVTVAIYVFYKSWSGDKKIMQAAILLFFVGILKCILKPWDLKGSSINSLASSSGPKEEDGRISSHNAYIQAAKLVFQADEAGEPSDTDEDIEDEFWGPYSLCVDLAPTYSIRLRGLKNLVQNPEDVHIALQFGLSNMFDRLYTKQGAQIFSSKKKTSAIKWLLNFLFWARSTSAVFTLAVIGLFHKSHKGAYNGTDVKITFTLIWCTGVLEYILPPMLGLLYLVIFLSPDKGPWPDQVAQYNLLGYLARCKKRTALVRLASAVECTDYLDQLRCMRPCRSSRDITNLIYDYLSNGWKEISDPESYRAFNGNRGQRTLKKEQCNSQKLEHILQRPFDESVLFWHLATDFCLHETAPPPSHQDSGLCREMSNYMAYLLFINPEMLIPGARRSLFREAYNKLNGMPLDEKTQLDGKQPMQKKIAMDEKELTDKVILTVRADTESSGVIHEAWVIAEELMALRSVEDQEKMWRVIRGVWVEMLCFSASWCKGYLHAKSLGKGGEYLSYVWLLLAYMGMETLAEKTQLQQEGYCTTGPTSAPPSTATGDNNV